LTLQAVADQMAARGLRITRAALHKYEAGKSRPSARTLVFLSEALGLPAHRLLEEPRVEIRWFAFRRHASLPRSAAERVQALAARRAENQLYVENLLGSREFPRFPKRQTLETTDDAERLAESVRRVWNLGDAPLESLTQTIEDHGGVVVEVGEVVAAFDGLSGLADGKHPVIVVNAHAPADRRRYTLAHEIGHLAMTCEEVPEREQEPLAHRFAGAFIVPARVARRELGTRRRRLDLNELVRLKAKHGLSIQAWVRRALDLEIISESVYRALCKQVGARGWRKVEPMVYDAERRPARLEQMLLRALSEGVVSSDEAEQLLPDIVRKSKGTPAGPSRRATDLLYASDDERDRVLSRAAESAAAYYAAGEPLRDFEAYGEKDLHDGSADS
jgi:Zn-dependent peptidase ImmA (M78 family)